MTMDGSMVQWMDAEIDRATASSMELMMESTTGSMMHARLDRTTASTRDLTTQLLWTAQSRERGTERMTGY